MLIKSCFAAVLVTAASLSAQENAVPSTPDLNAISANDSRASQQNASAVVENDTRMLTPPPVDGQKYAVGGTEEIRSNYLSGGVRFSSAYNDNVLGGATARPISDVSYSIWPTLELDKTSSRFHSLLTYDPGFTFYQRLSSRNAADESFSADVQYRVSPHVTISLRDAFQKTSNVLNRPDLGLTGGVSGSAQPPSVAVIVPVADRLTNTGNAQITYQFSQNAMVGAGGTFTNLHYPQPAEVPGLFDSSSKSGSAFYSHRVTKSQYFGAMYQYQEVLSYPKDQESTLESHTIFLFYTIYVRPKLSLSLSGGPQRFKVTQFPSPGAPAWDPAITVSLGWQGRYASVAASYSHIVTAGGGLLGAFHSNNANTSASWQFARSWNVGVAGSYSLYKNVEPLLLTSSPGGHTIAGTTSLRRQLGNHFNVEAGYTRLHQSYDNIAIVSGAPDTNREFISIGYQGTLPLGR